MSTGPGNGSRGQPQAPEGTAALHWVIEPERKHALALLVTDGDRAQMADPAFRRDPGAWVRFRRAASRDGISAAAFGMPDPLAFAGALVIRTFDMGEGQAARDVALADGSPALALLATPGDAPPVRSSPESPADQAGALLGQRRRRAALDARAGPKSATMIRNAKATTHGPLASGMIGA